MVAWGALLLLLAARGEALGSPGVSRPGPQAQHEEALVELSIGRLASRTVVALAGEGVILLPAREFFDLAEIAVSIDSTGHLTGVRQPENLPFHIDPNTGVASLGNSRVSLGHFEVGWQADALYVATAVLEKLLGIRFIVDWAALEVSVVDPEGLPVARRIARERARRALEASQQAPVARRLGGRNARWDGAVFDWAVAFPSGRPVDEMTYRLGLGLNVLGGSLEVAQEGTGKGLGGPNDVTASWLGVWPDRAWLKQLGLGDVFGTGPRPSSIRGAVLTNSPFVRPAAFADATLEGRLEPGWEVELYRDGELVGYSVTDARGFFELPAPIEYGPNPLEVRAYGPFGAVQVLHRAYRVEPDRLPAGVFEYGVAGGECMDRPCEAVGNLDLRYGISRILTVRAGFDAFQRDTLPDLFQPYGVVSGTVGRRWVGRAEVLWKGFAGADFSYEPTPDFRLSAGGRLFDDRVEFPLLTPVGRLWETQAFVFWRPIPRRRALFFEATGRRLRTETSTETALLLGAHTQTGGIRWAASVRHQRTEAAGSTRAVSFAGVTGSATLALPGVPILSGLFLRGGVEASVERGFEGLDVFVARHVGLSSRLEWSASWQRGTSQPFLAAGLTLELPGVRSFSQATRPPGGEMSATNLTEGAVIWNSAARRVEVARGRALRRGGVGGTVFLDLNANGQYDPGDEPLPGVVLRVGVQTARTDAHGRFAVWDLVPFVLEQVSVDSLSLRNPLWVPSFSLGTIVAAPNGYRRADIPVLVGAELTGRVTRVAGDGSTEDIGGVRLEIVNLTTGRQVSAITFHDGEFYVLGLTPGDYEVWVPEDMLEALDVEPPAGAVRFSIGSGLGGSSPPFVEVRLVERPS